MRVLLFARAKDLAGAECVEIDAPEPGTVGELRRHLVKRYPNLEGLMLKSAIAVNNEFAEDDTRIASGAEVALLPPVSGG